MARFDLSPEELKIYLPQRTEPSDFDSFWAETLDEARQHDLDARFEPVDYGLQTVDTYDLTFSGYGGQPIKGWFTLPRRRSGPLSCIVEYIGYGGGRAFPIDHLVWSAAGYAHLIMDTRGQGSNWSTGDTPDPEVDGGNAQYPGFMTRGILDKQTYYYRRVFTDAVRAVEAAMSNDAVDVSRIGVTGISQGGGVTLAVAGLAPALLYDAVVLCMPNVPFLCHYRRATEIVDSHPYGEIASYCKAHRDKIETVFETLSYFDGVNFAARATAPALFSTALMDTICPPSTVYAAYNHYGGDKTIRVWPYNQHEGGQSFQMIEQLKFVREIWG